MTDVEVDGVAVRPDAAALLDLLVDRAADHVARSEVHDRRRVPLHETLALGVQQDAALAADGLGEQDPQLVDPGRVELEELHVLQRDAAAEQDRGAVTGERVGVRAHLEHPAVAARRVQHGLGSEDVELARRELVGHDPRTPSVGHQLVEHVELVEEADVPLHALLVQRLQDHVAGPVGRVARASHGSLAVVAGMSAEPALVDLALRRAVERQPPVLELVDRRHRLLGHQEGGRLVDEVVAALDRVERVPLGRVLLDVGQGGAHPSLGRSRV